MGTGAGRIQAGRKQPDAYLVQLLTKTTSDLKIAISQRERLRQELDQAQWDPNEALRRRRSLP
jgi:hypothetical protein